jgi:hypothetical protein
MERRALKHISLWQLHERLSQRWSPLKEGEEMSTSLVPGSLSGLAMGLYMPTESHRKTLESKLKEAMTQSAPWTSTERFAALEAHLYDVLQEVGEGGAPVAFESAAEREKAAKEIARIAASLTSTVETGLRATAAVSSCDKAFANGLAKITVGAIFGGPAGALTGFILSTIDVALSCA